MVGYFILVHRYAKQFERLFKAIYDPKNVYLIHVDKRAGKSFKKEVTEFLSDYSNTHLLVSQSVVWGGYSMVRAELRGIKELLQVNKDWDTYINLSGQDFPLKTQANIAEFISKNVGKNFLLVSDQAKERKITMNRIENYFVETESGFSGKPTKRAFMANVVPYIGGQWKILTRSCCEFLDSSPKVAKFRKFYKNTLIPDESFFQTVLMNTDFGEKIVNDDKRAIVWIPDFRTKLAKKISKKDTMALVASGKVKLRPKSFTESDYKFLSTDKGLFARKFDESVDTKIFDLLELNLKDQRLAGANKIFVSRSVSKGVRAHDLTDLSVHIL